MREKPPKASVYLGKPITVAQIDWCKEQCEKKIWKCSHRQDRKTNLIAFIDVNEAKDFALRWKLKVTFHYGD